MFIKKFVSSMQYDKKLHFVAGFICGSAAIFDLFWGMIFLQIVALGKEYYDSVAEGHCVEFNDYTATVAGGSLSILLIHMVSKWIM